MRMMPLPSSTSSSATTGGGRPSSHAVRFTLDGFASPTTTAAGFSATKVSPYRLLQQNGTVVDHNNDPSQSVLSAFTPVITPKGDRSGSMVLLSPARTITESLANLASITGQRLEEVWDEVGYSPEDRASQLSDLILKFRDLCEYKIAEEKGVAETFRQTILEAREEIKNKSAALKNLIDPSLLQSSTGQTLMDELAILETELEGLRNAANAAREELKESRDYLIEAHEALGMEMDPMYRDVDTDLTTERRDVFHRKKMEMKEELTTRMAAVIQLVRDCQHMLNDLKIEPEKNGSELDRRIVGSLVRSKDGSFIMASKFRTDTCVGISSIALEELTKRVAELHGEKRRRKARLQEMGGQIAMLWEKLHVPDEDQIAFTESVHGLGMDTIGKGEEELRRLQQLKSDMLGKLFDEARDTISDLWDQINATMEEKEAFAPFHVRDESLYNDELLEQHEEYIGLLQSKLEQMKPIMHIIERREVVVRERYEYEELQKDPDRLKQRGAALTRQLMEEEKMARRIKRDLPKLTETLNGKLREWKEKHGEDFKYRGEVYVETMNRLEEEWAQYKADEVQRKLKKKQEEQSLAESRFPTQTFVRPAGTKKGAHPFSDARKKENTNRTTTTRVLHEPKKTDGSSHLVQDLENAGCNM